MNSRRRGRGRRLALLSVFSVGLTLGLVHIWMNKPESTKQLAVKTEAKPRAISASSRVLFAGTTYWGRYTNRAAERSGNRFKFPFEKLDTLKRGDYDAWVANLECPLSSKVNLTAEQEEENLSFNCSPDYLPEATKWFDVFGSANNHSDNQGEEAFAETRRVLDRYKIQYFGHYDPERKDEVCEIVGFEFSIELSDGNAKRADLPVAMCGFHGVFKIPVDENLAVMAEYSKYMPVVAYPHSGAEYKPGPDQIKTDLYRSMIDYGADMVIGDHPHWVQSTEIYKGKPIIYSMGNFMFDQQFNSEVVRSAAIDVTFSVKSDSLLDDWLGMGDCREFKDKCLEWIRQKNLRKLAYKYELGLVPTENRGYQTKLALGADAEAIRSRLDWDQLVSGLQAPYSAR